MLGALNLASGVQAQEDLILRYGDDLVLQTNHEDERWLTGNRGTSGNEVYLDCKFCSNYESERAASYIWIPRSAKGDGSTTFPDPKAGECVKFGDTIFVQNKNIRLNYLRSSCAGDESCVNDFQRILTTNVNAAGQNSLEYAWKFRSNPGNGAPTNVDNEDPAFGNCVTDPSIVFLQNLQGNDLMMGFRRGLVRTFYYGVGDCCYGEPFERNDYEWIIRKGRFSDGSRNDALQCSAVSARGKWVKRFSSNGDQEIQYTKGITRTATETFTRSNSWDLSVQAAIGTSGFGVDASVSVSASYAQSRESTVTDALQTSSEEKFKTSFGPGSVWQFQYDVNDNCVKGWILETLDLVVTKNDLEFPCCLPGLAVNGEEQHGPCLESTPCICSPDICNGGGSSSCFSSHTKVQVAGKGATSMNALKIGDSVLTGAGSYSKVYSFGHLAPDQVVSYLQIKVETIGKPLEISKNHLIYVYNQSMKHQSVVAAGQIKVGDFLISDQEHPVQVLSIKVVERQGAYAPMTAAGNIFVGGVLASNYVTRDWMPKLVSGQTMHLIQHGGIMWYHIYCSYFHCDNESYDSTNGYSPWVKFGFDVEEWVSQLHPVASGVILIFALLPVLLLDYCVGSIRTVPVWSLTHLAAVLLGYFSWKIGKHTNGRNVKLKTKGTKIV